LNLLFCFLHLCSSRTSFVNHQNQSIPVKAYIHSWVMGRAKGTTHIEVRTTTQERERERERERETRHTLTQNLKPMGAWVLLLIRCSIFTFFIQCGSYNSHLHTTLPLKCESIYSSCSLFKRKILLDCIIVAGFSATDRHCTAVAAFCANRPAALVVPFVEPRL
jgi:hypothetical protein